MSETRVPVLINEVEWLNRRKCEACGTWFYPPRNDAMWCSGACRQWAYRERKRSES